MRLGAFPSHVRKWRTKDGDTFIIKQMNDDHLINVLNLMGGDSDRLPQEMKYEFKKRFSPYCLFINGAGRPVFQETGYIYEEIINPIFNEKRAIIARSILTEPFYGDILDRWIRQSTNRSKGS